MKAFIKDALFGILVIILTLISAFVVTLPFNEVADEKNRVLWAVLINRELLLTALPTALITFLFAWLLKTRSRKTNYEKSTPQEGLRGASATN